MADARSKEFVIPARPDVLLQLSALVESEDPGFERVASLVKRDVALYANILALINSPFFGLRGRVSSIEKALKVMGMKRLLFLVRAASLRSAVGDDEGLENFWEDACTMATICANLTHYMPFVPADDAFTLGMMHACGVPLMVKNCPEFQRFHVDACLLDLPDQQRLEQAHYGTDQFQLSSRLARNWQVPEALCEAIAAQPHYQSLLMDEAADEALCQKVCLLLVGREFSLKFETLWGRSDEYQQVIELEPVLSFLGITEAELEAIQEHLFAKLQVDDRGIVPEAMA